MKVILNVPDNLRTQTFDLSMYLASKLYEDGLLSSGQAAEMVGVSKRTFIEMMGKYGVSVFSPSPETLNQDIMNA
jgi:predicted HTH domain antitoxin